MENLVGRKIKGFRFEGFKFNVEMKNYIGIVGVIVHQCQNKVRVDFGDDYWFYPIDQIQPHLIPLEVFKLGQKVWDMSISEEAGVVFSIDNSLEHLIIVDFQYVRPKYKIDGVNQHGQKTLSSAPYTFQGFSQETIIERGTVVYFRDSEKNNWNIGFYDEFKKNEHYCFVEQKKEGHSLDWTFCQTENPLI